MKTERYNWIDFIKAFAMLAVVIDHSFRIIYSNRLIQEYVFYSVTVFILIAGITSAISLSRREEVNFRYTIGRLSPILILYVIATFVYDFVAYQTINFSVLVHHLITFSAAPPFYFILFYIELVAISPFLYKIISKGNAITRVLCLVVIYIVSIFFINHTFIEGVILGGGVFLGGTYLFVYSLGMFAYFYLNRLLKTFSSILIFILSSIGLLFFVRSGFISHVSSNPPNLYLIIYSLILSGLLFSVWNLFIERVPFFVKLAKPFNLIGKYSLYVFMFHPLFLTFARTLAQTSTILQNKWILRVWIISWAVIPPLLIGLIINPFIERKHRIRFDVVVKKLNQVTEPFIQKWQTFLSTHPEFKFFLIVLALAYFARLVLVIQGGQFFWPDEFRFRFGYASFASLLIGDLNNFFSPYINYPAHSGFYMLSGIFGFLQERISQFTFGNFQEMYWVSALLFSILSVGNILLVYLISLKAGAARGEAFIAGAFMAASNSMFYYTRHLLPYDSSMFFALLALWVGLGEHRYRMYIICGLLIGTSIWVYTGYWIFCLAIVGILTLYHARSFLNWLLRGITIGIGSLLPIYVLFVFGLINGSLTSFSNMLAFLNSATQGSFREGWSLPWEYLWYSEHGVLLVWLVGLVAAIVILIKYYSASQKYMIYWVAAVVTIYAVFVIGSTMLEKFVIYGRFAREFIPFFCMIGAFSFYRYRNVFLRYRMLSLLGLFVLFVQVFYNFYTPLTQKWPKDFYLNVTQTYGDVFRDVTVLGPSVINDVKPDQSQKFLMVLNVDLPYPITGQKPEYSGKLLLRGSHPLAYLPYQYEGWSPVERSILRKSDLTMQLIEVDPVPDH